MTLTNDDQDCPFDPIAKLIEVPKFDDRNIDIVSTIIDCEEGTVCFEVSGDYIGVITWNFGDPTYPDSTSNETNPCYTYPSTGTYTVTLTNDDQDCPFDPIAKLIEVPKFGDRNINIISNIIDCEEGTICFEVSGNYVGGITWNFGDMAYPDSTSNETTPCYTYPNSGTYTVTLTNDFEECPFDTITKLIEVPKWTDRNVGILATLTDCEEGIICFEVTGDYIGGVTWNFGDPTHPDSTSNEITPCYAYSNSGTYTVTLTNEDELCPFDTITQLIEVPRLGDRTVEILSNLINCDEGTVCFGISGIFEGGVTWNFGDIAHPDSTSNEITPCYTYTNPGTYTVILTNNLEVCPFDTKTIEITVPEKLKLNTLPSIIVCQEDETELSVDANIMGTSFTWIDMNGDTIGTSSTLNYVGTENTTLTVFGVSPDGCTDSVQISIEVIDLMLSVSTKPQIICIGEEFTAEVNVNNADDYTFDWNPKDCIINGDGTNIAFFFALADKSYSVMVIEKSTGCKQLIEFTTDLTEPILAEFEGTVCEGQESNVMVIIENPENYDFEWSPENLIVSGGDTPMPVVILSEGQTLTVNITNKETGCSRELMYTPNVVPPIVINFAEPILQIFEGQSTTITIRNPQSGVSYSWSNGETGPSIDVEPIATTTYTVTATDVNGCTGTAQIIVNVRAIPCTEDDEYLPNAFTPNGDNFNDILFVKSNVIEEMTLVIFNRWGQEVFRATDINSGWDGTFQGKDCAPDAYSYYLRASCINGESFAKKGNVTLIR